ncbi:MAG: hypothetical protein A7315_12495 [Candidatus Altiarchaeales archaeon WOR_SM1_79]|nr:MAG: hypothetical protein A7315_12495 [Candidatus Altiarchaeales archaeon WOR_SM1_79]
MRNEVSVVVSCHNPKKEIILKTIDAENERLSYNNKNLFVIVSHLSDLLVLLCSKTRFSRQNRNRLF